LKDKLGDRNIGIADFKAAFSARIEGLEGRYSEFKKKK
jgi:hypothetical protein